MALWARKPFRGFRETGPCSVYKRTKNDVFDDSPKISDHFPNFFPKIFRNCSEGWKCDCILLSNFWSIGKPTIASHEYNLEVKS